MVVLLAGLLSACAAPATTALPPIRAVYLVTGPAVLTPTDLRAHPEVLVVHSFDELVAATHSKVSIWIDKSAASVDLDSWLNQAPQAWYPLVLVGDNNALHAFRDTLSLCCFPGPIIDWSTVRTEPGFCVIQLEDLGGPLPQATYSQCSDQPPAASDILAITDALLAGRLQTTPTPQPLAGASPTPAPQFSGFAGQVELDIFSGRPNPSWALSPADINTFQQKLGALPMTAAQPYPDRLGYRGLVVTLTDRASGKPAVVWQVSAGVAQIAAGTAHDYYADADQALETWLLQTGQPFLPADLFATVQAEIARKPHS